MKPWLVAGLGFRRDTDWPALEYAVLQALQDQPLQALLAVATLDSKAQAPALQAFCRRHDLPLRTFSAATLRRCPPPATPSAAQRQLGLPGVAEPCALLCAGPGSRLLRPRLALAGVTVALAVRPDFAAGEQLA